MADVCNVVFNQSDSSSCDTEVGYHDGVNVSWISGKDIHEQLEAIQCIITGPYTGGGGGGGGSRGFGRTPLF